MEIINQSKWDEHANMKNMNWGNQEYRKQIIKFAKNFANKIEFNLLEEKDIKKISQKSLSEVQRDESGFQVYSAIRILNDCWKYGKEVNSLYINGEIKT
jgi:hypothetical protein